MPVLSQGIPFHDSQSSPTGRGELLDQHAIALDGDDSRAGLEQRTREIALARSDLEDDVTGAGFHGRRDATKEIPVSEEMLAEAGTTRGRQTPP
jgi:hypothetical protein